MTALRSPSRRPRKGDDGKQDARIPAFAELADLLAQFQDRQLRKLSVFDQLTGARQLWWRCCEDAVRFRPGWLDQRQASEAMAIIRSGAPAHNTGAIAQAADATVGISRALAQPGPPGTAKMADLAASAAAVWRPAWSALPMPIDGHVFSAENALTAVHPELKGPVRALLSTLRDPQRDRGEAMVAISALMLAGAPARQRSVDVPVVLVDRRQDGAEEGIPGRLEVSEFPHGPAGLFPDPSIMRIQRTNTAFNDALAEGWRAATGGRANTCVLWRLSLDPGTPDHAIDDGSLGLPFAVVLHQLLHGGPMFGPSALARPMGLLMPLRAGCAITGILEAAHPGARPLQRIAEVGGMDSKLQAAATKSWRLVAPQANREPFRAGVPAGVHVDWASTVRQADWYARRVLPRTIGAAVLVVGLIAGGLTVLRSIENSSYQHQIARQALRTAVLQRTNADVDTLITQSESTGATDPVLAKQEAITALRLDPDSAQARYAALAAAALPGIAVLSNPGTLDEASFSLDGKVLAVAADTRSGTTVRLWNLRTLKLGGKPITFPANYAGSLAFSPDDSILAISTPTSTLLWDIAAARAIEQLPVSAGPMAFSPDGKVLAIATGNGAQLWDVDSGKPVSSLLQSPGGIADSEVLSLAFSPDGKTLATGGLFTIQLWDVATGLAAGPPISLHDVNIDDLAFSSDGATLAVAAVGVDGERSSGRVYDVATRQEIGSPVFTGESDLVTISQGGTILASAARTLDGTTYLFDTATGQQIGDPFTGGEQIAGMMFTPDGTTLATSSFDGTIRLWNVASAAPTPFGTQVTNYEYQSPYVTFMPDGKTLATGSTSARLQFWQVTTHRLVRSMFQPGWASVALSPDDTFAATDTRDGTIRVRSMTTLRLTHEPFTVPGGGRVGITALSVGGKILAVTTTTSSGDSTFRLWDTATGRPIGAPIAFPVSGAGINTMEFSRSGKYFAAGAWTVSPSSSVTLWVQLWDTATWRPVGHPLSMFSPILTSPVRAVAFNTAGTDLAVGGGLGAQVWDIATLKPVGAALLDQDVGDVYSVAFSPDGTILASADDEDGLVQLWDIATGLPIGAPLTPLGDLYAGSAVAFSPDGTWLAVTSAEGATQLWNVAALENPAVYLCSTTGALTPAQWAMYVPGLPYQNVCDPA
ncbi:MAG TPA: WD40 repeat domain-containing protein [Streptosporangiaceae bacterium]|nr:WD40 repeat domain-containing protein [Streptosporangiaceae bacterium]